MLYDVTETARLLGGIHPQTVRRMIRRRELRATRVGSRVMVDAADIAAYIAEHKLDDDDVAGTSLRPVRPGDADARRRHPSSTVPS